MKVCSYITSSSSSSHSHSSSSSYGSCMSHMSHMSSYMSYMSYILTVALLVLSNSRVIESFSPSCSNQWLNTNRYTNGYTNGHTNQYSNQYATSQQGSTSTAARFGGGWKHAAYHRERGSIRTRLQESTLDRALDVIPAQVLTQEGEGLTEGLRASTDAEKAAKIFINSMLGSLNGGQELESIISKDCAIKSNSILGISSTQDLIGAARKFADFFSEPQILLLEARGDTASPNTLHIRCQFSFWYPLPWRPRVIIPIEASLTTGNPISEIASAEGQSPPPMTVTNIDESWGVSAASIFFQQMVPRWWDIWHVFTSPGPEYPPITRRVAPSIDKVEFTSLPETLAMEVQWEGALQYPGPPLTSVPSFSLFGSLKGGRRNREPYFTVLPVEVRSERFIAKEGGQGTETGEQKKRSVWVYHVPTHLQALVMDQWEPHLRNGQGSGGGSPPTPLDYQDGADVGENTGSEEQDEVEYQVGYDNLNLMRSVSGGTVRGNLTVSEDMMADFERRQSISYRYTLRPKRLIAETSLKGEVDGAKIQTALSQIKAVIGKSGRFRVKPPVPGVSNSFGLQSWATKVCFNSLAQPAMAIYEMQYDGRITKIFLEVEEVS